MVNEMVVQLADSQFGRFGDDVNVALEQVDGPNEVGFVRLFFFN